MIVKLEAALASGTLTIESDGERITYRSVRDLRSAIDYFRERQTLPGGNGSPRPASTLAVYDPS